MAYDKNFPANDSFLADFPEKQRAQIEAIINDAIVNAKTVLGLQVGNDNGNIPVANGTECKNLNAGLLGGKTAGDMAPKIHGHDTATPSSDGFMSNVDKTKLNTIAENAQVNPNVFTNIKIGNLVLQPDAKDDTLELVAGANIALTPDTTNDKINIAVTGTVPNAGAVNGASLSQLVRADVSQNMVEGVSHRYLKEGGWLLIGGIRTDGGDVSCVTTDGTNLVMDSKVAGHIYLGYYGGKQVNFCGGTGSIKSYIDADGVFRGTAGNSNTVAGLAVSGGRNNVGNQIVRTDGNGYLQTGYINSSGGDEGNNSNPVRVWGTNGGDSYLRTYLTSALSVKYANTAGDANKVNGHVFNWSGQSGQPTWLWGGNDADNMYVYNPSNFNVNYANGAGNVGGYTAATLLAAMATGSTGGNGWTKLQNGFIIQWGKVVTDSHELADISFPIKFTNNVFGIWGERFGVGDNTSDLGIVAGGSHTGGDGYDTTGFYMNANDGGKYFWFAIGN